MDNNERIKNALKVLGKKHTRVIKASKKNSTHQRKFSSRPVSAFVDTRVHNKSSYYSCARKRRYHSASDAANAKHKALTERGTVLRVYQCRYCGGYHLTKKEFKTKTHLTNI